MSEGVELKDWMKRFVEVNGGVARCAKMLSLHENVIRDVLSGNRIKLPVFVLKKLGLRAVVKLYPIDAKPKP